MNRGRKVSKDGCKTCSKCKEHKPLDQFFNYKRGLYSKESRCKSCKQRYARSRLEDPAYKAQRNKKNFDSFRKRKYGLSPEDIENLLKSQGYCCKICKIHLDSSEPNKTPHIDHCHSNGHVRGILCPRCNTGLGSFKDNEDSLLSAIQYLRETNGNR